jgi:hypothetical protein
MMTGGVSRLASMVAVILLIAISSACSSTRASHGVDPSISQAEAGHVLADYLSVRNRATTAHDSSLAATVETGALGNISQARFALLKHGKSTGNERFALGHPVFAIPRLNGYPRWFAVFAITRAGTATTLVFSQHNSGTPWLAEASLTFPDGTRTPSVAVDSAGYATANTAVSPSHAVSEHVSCLNSGSGMGDCSAMIPGMWTTGVAGKIREASTKEWRVRSNWTVDRYPIAAVRTADGGTFIWYSVTETGSAVNAGNGSPVPLAPETAALAGRTLIRTSFSYVTEYEFGAQLQANGKVAIVAENHQMVAAHGSLSRRASAGDADDHVNAA